jgi:hypothetical protein
MVSDWLAYAALLVIHAGGAAFVGSSLRRKQSGMNKAALICALVLTIGSCLIVPLPWMQRVGLVSATAVAFLSFMSLHPVLFPARAAWAFSSITMLLILVWSLAAGRAAPEFGIGLAAALAALLTLRRVVTAAG